MSGPYDRLDESRKQIRIAAEKVDDRALLDDLHEAAQLVRAVQDELVDREEEEPQDA